MSQNWFFFFYNIDILNFLLSNICIKPDIVGNKNNNYEMSLNTKRNTIIKQASKAMLLDFDFDVWCFNKNAGSCTPFTEDFFNGHGKQKQTKVQLLTFFLDRMFCKTWSRRGPS